MSPPDCEDTSILCQRYHPAHFDANKHGGMRILKMLLVNHDSINFKTMTHFGLVMGGHSLFRASGGPGPTSSGPERAGLLTKKIGRAGRAFIKNYVHYLDKICGSNDQIFYHLSTLVNLGINN